MNDKQNITEAFDNHRQACANAIAAFEAIIQMDNNATPHEANCSVQ